LVYIGNHAVHLPINYTQLNGNPRQFLSTLGTRDPNQTYSANSVPTRSPAANQPNTATTTPFNYWRDIRNSPVGPDGSTAERLGRVLEQNSTTPLLFPERQHPLQKPRFAWPHIVFNYIIPRLMGANHLAQRFRPVPEKRVSPIDHPQRYVTAITYELPIGKGKAWTSTRARPTPGSAAAAEQRLHSRWADTAVVNGSSSSPRLRLFRRAPMNLDNRQVNGPAFNTACSMSSRPTPSTFTSRTFSTTFSNLRADGINQWTRPFPSAFAFTRKAP